MMVSARKVSFMAALFACFLFFVTGHALHSQEVSVRTHPGRAVEVQITARIIEQNGQMAWSENYRRVTIAGRAVGLRLQGDDLVVDSQFTPFLRPDGKHTLVALGQIWISIPDKGINYFTTMQTIPLEYGEQVYFFPLGSMKPQEGSHIEIQLTLEPHNRLVIDNNSPDLSNHPQRRGQDTAQNDTDKKSSDSP